MCTRYLVISAILAVLWLFFDRWCQVQACVDEVTSVSEVYVTFMLCTWRFGGVAEGSEGKGEVERS